MLNAMSKAIALKDSDGYRAMESIHSHPVGGRHLRCLDRW